MSAPPPQPTSASQVPPAVFAVDDSIGATMIGILLTYFLMGVIVVQAHAYYRNFPNDPRWIKVLVASVIILEIGQSICAAHVLYWFAVKGYGQPAALLFPPKSFGLDSLLTVILKVVVQLYFAYRIWRLTSSMIPPMIATGLTFLALGFGLVIASYAIAQPSIPSFERKVLWLLPTSLSVSATVDIFIAGVLINWLSKKRSQALSSTLQIVDNLLAWSIQTGLITSVTAVTQLICFVTMRHNFIWITFYVILPKLYSNSLLASLNGRMDLREMRTDIIEMGSESIGGFHARSGASKNTSSSKSSRMDAFKIGFSGSRAYDSRETRSNISDPGMVKVDVTTKTDQESY